MKRFTALILGVLMVFSLLTLSSCSGTSTPTATPAASAKPSAAPSASPVAATKNTIKPGVLTIGVDDSYPPMEFKDDKGATVGFDIDLAAEVAKRLGVKVEFVSTAWDGIFQALNTSKYDAIFSSVSVTDERLKNFELTKPYIANSQIIIVKPNDNSVKSAKDLTGKKVGVQISTTSNESADYLLKKENIKFTLSTYDTIIQPFQDMKAGRLDAIIVDEVVGQYYITADASNFKSAGVNLTNEPIGVCFKKGNTALRDEVQKAIDAMIADGTMKKISQKWFGKDLTSNIDTKIKTLG